MCWNYSDCGVCGKRTECTSVSDSPSARDCKSFNTCQKCDSDICDDCFYFKSTKLCNKCKEKKFKYAFIVHAFDQDTKDRVRYDFTSHSTIMEACERLIDKVSRAERSILPLDTEDLQFVIQTNDPYIMENNLDGETERVADINMGLSM